MKLTRLPAVLLTVVVGGAVLQAQSAGPRPTPLPPPIPAPQDRPFPGTIRLAVDATDIAHRVFSVHETIPVAAPGPMILLFPQWIPGHHSPNGPIQDVAGLAVRAGGRTIPWTRDRVDVYAFHVTVPTGASAIDVDFQDLSPVAPRVGRVMVTDELIDLEWSTVAFYPAGYYSRNLTFEPSVRVPDGWQIASALDGASTSGATTTFAPVTFNTLVDSPVFAGRYVKRYDLDPGAAVPVRLDVFADRADEVEMPDEALNAHRALVQQAYALYGSHHYDHYDFLLGLSDRLGGIGLEHHRSSQDVTGADYFTNWKGSYRGRDLLAHEYTHSWNGKFRRPADLWTPNFDVPMGDSLLWVYEGQTQYWGYVLAARAGLLTKQQTLDSIAETAAVYANRAGREWRPLEDTTNDPSINFRRPQSWRSYERSEDYYSEGQLIWLDADTLIREKSNGAKSLDDFARAFFGIDNGSDVTKTYTLDDVVATLNQVLPYDWATFLKTRVDEVAPNAPLDGLARGGYTLVYTDTPGSFGRRADLSYSVGLTYDGNGTVTGVQWGGPAFNAGLTADARIMGVNGGSFSGDRLDAAITAAKGTDAPIELTVSSSAGRVWTTKIDYHDGLRYPHLERVASTPARLDDILAPRTVK
jgi:predicted metalloprotease with PDZ domain